MPSSHPLASAVFDRAELDTTPTSAGECRNFLDAATRTLARLECHESTVNPRDLAAP